MHTGFTHGINRSTPTDCKYASLTVRNCGPIYPRDLIPELQSFLLLVSLEKNSVSVLDTVSDSEIYPTQKTIVFVTGDN